MTDPVSEEVTERRLRVPRPPRDPEDGNVIPFRFRFMRGDEAEICDATIASLNPRRDHLVFSEGRLYEYIPDSGIWAGVSRDRLLKIIRSFAGCEVGEKGTLKVSSAAAKGAITFVNAEVADEFFFSSAPVGLCFSDCFASIETGDIIRRAHSADHRARLSYPFPLPQSLDSPRWFQFLEDTFADYSEDERAAVIALLQEFCGAALCGLGTRYQKCLVCFGPGDNGKSKFVDVIKAVMPRGSVCSVSPQKMSDERQKALLSGILLNTVVELPEADILDSESFKAVITGDQIQGKSLYRDPFMLSPVAAHLFGANRLPATNDATEGFWRRWIVVPFTHVVPPEKRDPDIAINIIRDESPGVIRWMLEGAIRLVARRSYDVPASCLRALDVWRREADQARLFIDECTAPADSDFEWTLSSKLYKHYATIWCPRTGHRPMNLHNFGKRLTLACPNRHTENGTAYPLKLSFSQTILQD